jgi:hypothetical protein
MLSLYDVPMLPTSKDFEKLHDVFRWLNQFNDTELQLIIDEMNKEMDKKPVTGKLQDPASCQARPRQPSVRTAVRSMSYGRESPRYRDVNAKE